MAKSIALAPSRPMPPGSFCLKILHISVQPICADGEDRAAYGRDRGRPLLRALGAAFAFVFSVAKRTADFAQRGCPRICFLSVAKRTADFVWRSLFLSVAKRTADFAQRGCPRVSVLSAQG